MGGFWGFFGGIFGAIVGAIAAIPAVPAIVGGAVIGIILCATGTICPSGTGNNHNNSGGTTVITAPNPTNPGKSTGKGSGSVGGGAVGAICSSAGANDCGMHGTGVLVGGVCNASVPQDSACPAPVISTNGFYANPTLVKSGEQSTLYWSVAGATSCTLKGGGLDGLLATLSGTKLTGSITQKTIYTLTCQDGGNGGPTASASATVNLDPSYQNK